MIKLSDDEKKERHNAQCKRYRENNKEKCKEYAKEWRENNRQSARDSAKKYYESNREQLIQKMLVYAKTPTGKKSRVIARWRMRGVVSNDFDKLYDQYSNTKECENCEQEFGPQGNPANNWKCLDHCHVSGEFRQVLCNMCNLLRG